MSNEEKKEDVKQEEAKLPLVNVDKKSQKKQKSHIWVILIAVGVYVFLTLINFWALSSYKNNVESLVKNSAIQNIDKATDFLKNNSQIVILEEEIERAKLEIDSNYRDFLMKYYENQNNCLTMWLAALGIILAVFGVVIPLCFMKLFENKREEMNQVIHDVKDYRHEAIGCLEEVNQAKKRVVEELEDKRKEVKKLTKEYDDLKAQVDEAATSLKKFVAESKKTMAEYKKIEKEIMEIAKTIKKQAQQVSEDKSATEVNKYFAMGLNLFSDKKYDEALVNFNIVLDYYNNDNTLFREIGMLYHYFSVIYFCKEEYKKAEIFCTKALESMPDNIIFLSNRTKCFVKLKEYEKAQQDAEKAILLDPDAPDGYSALAIMHAKQNNYFEAKKYMLKAINLGGKNSVNYDNFGVYCLKLGEFDEALSAILTAINFERNYLNAYYNLTEVYLFKKNFKNALATLKNYIEKEKVPCIFGDDYDLWMGLLDKAESDEDKKTAEEIRELIKTKLTKKPRED